MLDVLVLNDFIQRLLSRVIDLIEHLDAAVGLLDRLRILDPKALHAGLDPVFSLAGINDVIHLNYYKRSSD